MESGESVQAGPNNVNKVVNKVVKCANFVRNPLKNPFMQSLNCQKSSELEQRLNLK